jgi:hypothetical protein
MKYASKECGRCSRILPANEMLKAAERISTGSSDHYSLKNGSYKPTGTTRTYKNETVFLCPECAEKRRVWQKRKLGLSAGAGAVLLAIYAFSGEPESVTRELPSEGMIAAPETEPDVPMSLTPSSGPLENAREVREASPEQVSEPSPLIPDGHAAPSDKEMVEQLDNWIGLALSDDRDTEWSMGNQRGMIQVSAAPSSGGRTCRAFTVNVRENGVSRQIGNGRRCASMGNGGWVDE